MSAGPAQAQRRRLLQAMGLAALPTASLMGCAGDALRTASAGPRMAGRRTATVLVSRTAGASYPINLWLPPPDAGPSDRLPIVYALDGDTWFDPMVNAAESSRAAVILVGIGNSERRTHDFLPASRCVDDGGGHAAYFEFIRTELSPHIESTIGGDPRRRALFGHSYGGAFALYALFAQEPGRHHFATYLVSEASVGCLADLPAWEQAYADRYGALPVRLHTSYAMLSNHAARLQFAETIDAHRYRGLIHRVQGYPGQHSEIIPAAFRDGLAFMLEAG